MWQFLFGVWTPRSVPEARLYQGDNPKLQGHKGTWATLGRMGFSPCSAESLENIKGAQVAWHYFLLQPRKGTPYSATSLGCFFRAPAYRLLGKRITPHVMRHLWATWGYRKGLTEREIESLAFAMGHRAETLKAVYQHISNAERLKPLQDVLRGYYESQDDSEDISMAQLKSSLKLLTPQQRGQLREFLDNLEAS